MTSLLQTQPFNIFLILYKSFKSNYIPLVCLQNSGLSKTHKEEINKS